MLTERLKIETQVQHLAVEKLIIPRIKNLDSNNSYIDLLQIFYGYFSPLEEIIDTYIPAEVIGDMSERRKAASIIKDIDTFDINAPIKSTCSDLPSITSVEEAIGAMYVLEGSTLGGVHLTKMIASKMDLEGNKGLTFFNGYGPDTIKKWETFKTSINAAAIDEASQDKVIEAANNTFIKFKDWIEKN